MFSLLLPENNFIATKILSRRIEAELDLAGQAADSASFGGPLNSSVMRFCVHDAHKSARVLIKGVWETIILSCVSPRFIAVILMKTFSAACILPVAMIFN